MGSAQATAEAWLREHDVVRFAARTPTLPPATHTNSYALGTREVLLVEPATPYLDEQRAWLAWANKIRSQGRELVGLLITHYHPDHVGGAVELATALGIELWAHTRTTTLLSQLPIGRQLQDGDAIVLGGQRPQQWNCLHTPGHAPDHLCLHEPQLDVAVVGDMVASVGTILIGDDGDLAEYLIQLERLEKLEARYALPAHGEPIPKPSLLFRYYIEHRLMRENKVLAALRSADPNGASEEAITPLAYPDVPAAVHPLATVSVRAHLRKLLQNERVERCPAGWRLGGNADSPNEDSPNEDSPNEDSPNEDSNGS